MRIVNNIAQQALLHFISNCCHAQDWTALKPLGLSRRQALKIGSLSQFECNILGDLSGCFSSFRLNFSRLRACIERVQKLLKQNSLSGAFCREADLFLHLCHYITNLYRDNQRDLLCEIGISPVQAEYISLMPFAVMQGTARHFWDFATVEIDQTHMERAIDSASSIALWIRQCTQLIQAGAPRDLMTRYYGMSCELYAEAREMHGRQTRGRPRMLSDDTQELLYAEFIRQYQHYGETQIDPLRQPGFFLALYDAMEQRVSLREIWRLVQQWVRGDFQYKQVKRREMI